MSVIPFKMPSAEFPAFGWWSGGVTSAVAIYFAIEMFGLDAVRIIFIDTRNEHGDTYRFKKDCEVLYRKEIETISSEKWRNIRDVWYHYNSLNIAKGAVCSSSLKREVREAFERSNPFSCQVFGFDISEPKRAVSLSLNYPKSRAIFPLLTHAFSKRQCIDLLLSLGVSIPASYHLGLLNNNCLQTGCVQGGIGYWQLLRVKLPHLFFNMASVEHELTDRKGWPVTMLRDQSKNSGPVFLLPHPSYPLIKDISMLKGVPPKPLFDCNGLCGVNDLAGRNGTELELNYL